MRKEKCVGKEFLFPWIRGICASLKSRAGCAGAGSPRPASPNNGRAMPAWTPGRGKSRGSAFMAPF